MKKIQAQITISFPRTSSGGKYCSIEIIDVASRIHFVEAKISGSQFLDAMSGVGYVDCEAEIRGLDNVGKKHENKRFEFAVPSSLNIHDWKRRSETHEALRLVAQAYLDDEGDGWIAEEYFGSQDSFFEKDGKQMARVTIRRWVP